MELSQYPLSTQYLLSSLSGKNGISQLQAHTEREPVLSKPVLKVDSFWGHLPTPWPSLCIQENVAL